MIQLRPAQKAVMAYTGGRMAISAVPGSGKTTTLSLLAAELVAARREGQVLVVTFSNAAASNFKHRIAGFLQERRLPRQAGYDVRTLHSLAHLLVQEHAVLLGLDPEYRILDEREAASTRLDAANRWMERHRETWLDFIRPAAGGRPDDRTIRRWREQTVDIAATVIRNAKLGQSRPDLLPERLSDLPDSPELALARMGASIYALYQQQLETRGAVDFDDLIWLACTLLQDNPALLSGLRARWPYILEDEAQDSSPLQERILEMLAGPDGNWVRVGDPNQAINATFTSADPRNFRRFCRRPGVYFVTLDQSGRSAGCIMDLANNLVRWACERHPEPDVRPRAFEYQQIRPVDAGDPQPNPPDEESGLVLNREFDRWQDELADAAERAIQYSRRFPERTLAILTATNVLADELGKILRGKGVEFDELSRTPASARHVVQTLATTLDFIADAANPRKLSALFTALVDAGLLPLASAADPRHIARLLSSCRPEAFLFPEAGQNRRTALPPRDETTSDDFVALDQFGERAARWVRAALLPTDELILTVGAELFRSPFDLATVQQLAATVRRIADDMPALSFPDLAREVHDMAFGPRGLTQSSRYELGFEPQKGRITVATMHSAKGLEWDLVYLVGCNRDWFPLQIEDCYSRGISFTEGADTQAEIAALVRTLTSGEPAGARSPTREAQLELIAERLRLLYVGITRARRNLAISWSATTLTSNRYDRGVEMAPVIGVLREAALPAGEPRA